MASMVLSGACPVIAPYPQRKINITVSVDVGKMCFFPSSQDRKTSRPANHPQHRHSTLQAFPARVQFKAILDEFDESDSSSS
jgi:hypothetical protein